MNPGFDPPWVGVFHSFLVLADESRRGLGYSGRIDLTDRLETSNLTLFRLKFIQQKEPLDS